MANFPDLRANRLDVSESLNDITVKCNGQLDVLLIDSPEEQEIPARKSFKNLTVNGLIGVTNNIANSALRRFFPLIIDELPHEVLDDLRINGNVELSKVLKVHDLKPANSGGSMREVLANGVKITVNFL